MIVGAADHALFDLSLNCTPTGAVLDFVRDIPTLARCVNVVEIKHNRVVLATVDTGVATQIFEYAIHEVAPLDSVSVDRLSHVVVAISSVVLAHVRTAAGAAVNLTQSRCASLEVELVPLAHLPAAWTQLCLHANKCSHQASRDRHAEHEKRHASVMCVSQMRA
jgi:hypothetical protein